MVDIHSATAEIRRGKEEEEEAPANVNGFRVLAALLHGTLLWASAKLCGVEQTAPPIFGRVAMTLDIGPHSTFI